MADVRVEEELTEPIPALDSDLRHPPAGERISMSRAFWGRSSLRETLETILLTVLIFLVLYVTTGRFQVRGSSMEPTLFNGQYLVVSKAVYWIRPVERGDVIVFHPPNNPDDDYIKRVVGLPGENLEIRDGVVWVDGMRLAEPMIENPGSYSGFWKLQDDEYFVLGDNRRNSSDSHTWGLLPRENIIGKAWLCYWPLERWGLVTHYIFPPLAGPGE